MFFIQGAQKTQGYVINNIIYQLNKERVQFGMQANGKLARWSPSLLLGEPKTWLTGSLYINRKVLMMVGLEGGRSEPKENLFSIF